MYVYLVIVYVICYYVYVISCLFVYTISYVYMCIHESRTHNLVVYYA